MRLRMPLTIRGRALLASSRFESAVWIGFELAVLACWTLFLTRRYLNFDPLLVPYGKEYFIAIQTHYLWDNLRECGACALWIGNLNGGYPAAADVHNAMLFPPVIVGSLLFGVLNGAKVALIFTFFLAGFAQWWLGWILGLGRVARLWTGAMAVAAGGLAIRMDFGFYSLVTSTACGMLIIPAAIQLSRDGRLRSATVLGITIALFILSGQGYLQIGFVFLAPFLLILILGNPIGPWRLFKRFALACGIGILIAAPLVVPAIRFNSHFQKPIEPDFGFAQPFKYIPLNLVVSDLDFFHKEVLGTLQYNYLNPNYIGWTAVIFAGIGCYALWRQQHARLATFLMAWTVGALWVSSGAPMMWIRDHTTPGGHVWSFIVTIRFPGFVATLAIPTLLVLSGFGIDHLLRVCSSLKSKIDFFSGSTNSARTVRFDLRWLLMLPLFFGLHDLQNFSEQFLRVSRQPAKVTGPVLAALTTPDAQWVGTPFGSEYWVGPGMEQNLLVSPQRLAWSWNHPAPTPVLVASPSGKPVEGMTLVNTLDGYDIYAAPPGNEFAAVVHLDGTRTVCSASNLGGDIDVICDLPQPGRLEVKENYYAGWKAKLSGNSLDVSNSNNWLGVDLPAGKSTIELRYRPWDVPLGIALMIVGLAIAAYCIVRREPGAVADESTVVDLTQPSPADEAAVAD